MVKLSATLAYDPSTPGCEDRPWHAALQAITGSTSSGIGVRRADPVTALRDLADALEQSIGKPWFSIKTLASISGPPVAAAGVPDDMAGWVSPVPQGWDTVLGWTAKHNPAFFDLCDDPISGTVRDGYWLTHRCRERGINAISVDAPAHLAARGIRTVNAYPTSLVAQRCGG